MATFTAQDLITRAEAIADMRDNFVSPAEWMDWLNREQYALRIFLARVGWVLDTTTTSALVTSSTAWTLTTESTSSPITATASGYWPFTPSDVVGTIPIMAVVCVHEINSQGGVRPLKFTNTVDFLKQNPGAIIARGHAREFRLSADSTGALTFGFYPELNVSEQYLVTYIREPTRVTALTDNVSQPMGWEERLVLGMARRALIKEESETTKVEALIREMDQQIEELAWSRVLSTVPAVRRVDNLTYAWDLKLDFPPWSEWAWV
jgi:hypothetical protein